MNRQGLSTADVVRPLVDNGYALFRAGTLEPLPDLTPELERLGPRGLSLNVVARHRDRSSP